VRDAYDAVSEAWTRARRAGQDAREREWLERFFAMLPDDSAVLDLGCGSGAPILVETLARGHRAIGVDFSREQLNRARSLCPSAPLIQADIAAIQFASMSFNGVIAYDSIWHIPIAEHSRIFERIADWLVDGGAALLTLAAVDDKGELFTELEGAPIFYDARPEPENLRLLRAAGLTIVGHHVRGGHMIILVSRRRGA